MVYKFRLLTISVILATSYADGSANCERGGIGSRNEKGIDSTFTNQVNVPVNGLGWTDSGANIQFNTFNCDQVIKTGDALTSMVTVGIRPVNTLLYHPRDTPLSSSVQH